MTFTPSHALQRAVPLGAALVIVALLLGRMDILMLGVPFVVWVAWALWSRPGDGDRATLQPAGRVAVNEGDAFTWRVSAPGVVAAAWQPMKGVEVTGDGCVGEGEVSGEVHPQTWGRFRLGSPVVSVTDPSGAWRALPAMDALDVTVAPSSQSLEHGAGVRRPLGISGNHTSMHRGSGSALATVREFQPGDRLRNLHWRVTARTGRPHVVATHSDRDTDVLLVVDTLAEVYDPTGQTSSVDSTVRALTGIAHHYIREGDRVAVHDLGTWIGSLPAGTGQRQAYRVIDAASRADRTRKAAAAPRPVPRLTSGTLVFVISPLLEPAVLDEVVRLRHLGGEVACVDVLPEGAGLAESLDAGEESLRPEALVLLRAARDTSLVRLLEMGIPMASWSGPEALASLMVAMNQARHAPRRR